MFLKLEPWKEACIFKGASIFEGVLEVSIFEGGRLQELRRLLSLERILSRPSENDRVPSSFGEVILPSAIQLLSGDNGAFAVRSTALIGATGHLRRLERKRSGFCRQIHRPGRNDRVPSSFGEVILPSAIQLLSGDNGAFAVRSTALIGATGHLRRLERSDWAPSSFGEVILPSAIQLLSGNDRAFAVRSTVLVEAIGHLRRLERWRQNCTIDVFLEKQR
ncbi:hypothetical protein E6C27_scaffold616G00140 [Cucumis melo var. makuwa]|uniref:Uncharacterized protein n=1 Tax=Cucumis melo var. makuwa TaxID=1194695 RepID=A0A5A7V9I4_CUCMM|nr:hypothetical protein E6C27_scaffold616G00140 [Cucumis melo var. makuwa]